MRMGKVMLVLAGAWSTTASAEPNRSHSTRALGGDGDQAVEVGGAFPLRAVGAAIETKQERCREEFDTRELFDRGLDVAGVAQDPRHTMLIRGSGGLYEVDTCSGGLRNRGSTGLQEPCGLVFGGPGNLFSLDAATDALYRLDLRSGEATLVGELGLDLGSCGAAWDPLQGDIVVADSNSDGVFRVDPETARVQGTTVLSIDLAAPGPAGDAAQLGCVVGSIEAVLDKEPREACGRYAEAGPAALGPGGEP